MSTRNSQVPFDISTAAAADLKNNFHKLLSPAAATAAAESKKLLCSRKKHFTFVVKIASLSLKLPFMLLLLLRVSRVCLSHTQ